MTGEGLPPLQLTEKEELTVKSGSEKREEHVMFHLLCAHPFGIVPYKRCSQPRDALSRNLLEFLSGAISDPFPNPPKGVPRCPILAITAHFKMPIMAEEPMPPLRVHSFPMSASRLHAASPSDTPSARATSSTSALGKARVACVVLRVLMRLHPRKTNPPLVDDQLARHSLP